MLSVPWTARLGVAMALSAAPLSARITTQGRIVLSGFVTSQIGGVPAGLVSVPLIEFPGVNTLAGGCDGNYELYLRVERVP